MGLPGLHVERYWLLHLATITEIPGRLRGGKYSPPVVIVPKYTLPNIRPEGRIVE